MPKRLPLIIFVLLFSVPALCQVKDVIDRDIPLIKYIPDDVYLLKNWKNIRKQNAKYRKQNPQYHEILSLDTSAIPYLVDKISDTTATGICIPCSTHNLVNGDVAFSLLNDIIPIPMGLVTHGQWDVISCDAFPDGVWDYLHDNRLRFQNELKQFFLCRKGKLWIRLLKTKITKDEANLIQKEIFAN